jgi:hypothetical protein
MLNEGIQVSRDAKGGLLKDLLIDVIEKNQESLLGKDLGKSVPHNPRPDDGDLFDLAQPHILLLFRV